MPNHAHFEIVKTTRPSEDHHAVNVVDHHWRLRAANGEIVASGETHGSAGGARRALDDVLEAFGRAVFFDIEHVTETNA